LAALWSQSQSRARSGARCFGRSPSLELETRPGAQFLTCSSAPRRILKHFTSLEFFLLFFCTPCFLFHVLSSSAHQYKIRSGEKYVCYTKIGRSVLDNFLAGQSRVSSLFSVSSPFLLPFSVILLLREMYFYNYKITYFHFRESLTRIISFAELPIQKPEKKNEWKTREVHKWHSTGVHNTCVETEHQMWPSFYRNLSL